VASCDIIHVHFKFYYGPALERSGGQINFVQVHMTADMTGADASSYIYWGNNLDICFEELYSYM
jgi:hypothetical protein